MQVKQLSIFLENKTGRLAEVTKVLGESKINIRALSLADTSDFGILRLIVNDMQKAKEILKEQGFTVAETRVVAVEVPDSPGGLGNILSILDGAGLNVEYMYAFVEKASEHALLIFRFEDTEQERAIKVLLENNVSILREDQVYSL